MDDTLNDSRKVQQESLQASNNIVDSSDLFNPMYDVNDETFQNNPPESSQTAEQIKNNEELGQEQDATTSNMSYQVENASSQDSPILQQSGIADHANQEKTLADHDCETQIGGEKPVEEKEKITPEEKAEQLANRFEEDSNFNPEEFIEKVNQIKNTEEGKG